MPESIPKRQHMVQSNRNLGAQTASCRMSLLAFEPSGSRAAPRKTAL